MADQHFLTNRGIDVRMLSFLLRGLEAGGLVDIKAISIKLRYNVQMWP